MQRLFAHPAARAIRAQKLSGTSSLSLRIVLAASCRKFSATALVNARSGKGSDPSLFEGLDELLEGGELDMESFAKPASSTPTSRPKPSVKKPLLINKLPPRPTNSSPDSTLASPDFNPESLVETWLEPTQEALSHRKLSLFDYIVGQIESVPTLEVLAKLDDQNALEFKKRWICYEMEQDNPRAHLPLVEFFLHHGLVLLPPTKDSVPPSQRIQRIASDQVEKIVGSMQRLSGRIARDVEGIEQRNPPPQFPDLMKADPLIDPHDAHEFPPSKTSPFHNRVVVYNHRSVFHQYNETEGTEDDLLEEDELPDNEMDDFNELKTALPVESRYYGNLHQTVLMRRGVVQQTGKGKIRRISFMVLVGDGNGLVGYGEGKHSSGATAIRMARVAAVRNMDWVERFEKRTIWTEMSTKLGSTQLILRPRPVGFGLRCNPHLHRILRAAGLKDISAKVWGSRNKLNVIKAAFRLLHAGHAPTGMGDGLGGKGKKLSKGGGLKSKSDLERARGRKLVDLRY